MSKIERLIQDEEGRFSFQIGRYVPRIWGDEISPRGKMRTLVVENPSDPKRIEELINEMASNSSAFIPKGANSYVASDFNCDTQHIREQQIYSVYAIQFYFVRNSPNS